MLGSYIFLNIILENLLKGLTVPGEMPQDRRDYMTKQMSTYHKSSFIMKKLIAEIVRLHKLQTKTNGLRLDCESFTWWVLRI